MNNLIIAALTFVMLPAFNNNASAKCKKECREAKTAFDVEKINFTSEMLELSATEDEYTSVDVDYIIEENGKAYITYIDAADAKAKNEVVKFIESASYNFNIVPGKVYSMQLTLKK
jgi:hypothetical protein